MIDYVGIVDVVIKAFSWHWSMIGWVIAFVLVVLLFTRLHKYVFKFALAFCLVGWGCAAFAGLTALWFIGWVAWVIPLSAILFMRFTMEYMMNLPYIPNNRE